MKPDTITTEIEIADVTFAVKIKFDRTPPVGEDDEEIYVLSMVVNTAPGLDLFGAYTYNSEFKARIDELVKEVIHDRRPDPNTELVDSRW